MAPFPLHRGRRAVAIENSDLQVTVLEEGGHIAEIVDKRTGINPLWTPAWTSVEPSAFDPTRHTEYGTGADAKLLAGIMGHNWCLDIFGPPSDAGAAAGLGPHGEASVARYDVDAGGDRLAMRASFPLAAAASRTAPRRCTIARCSIVETVENLSSCDRPIGWTQHVTLGPPFLQKGVTEFRASATRSKVFEGAFGGADYLQAGAAFEWPFAPRADGGVADLRRLHRRVRVERVHGAPDGQAARATPSSSPSRRTNVSRSATSGRRPIFRGSASGKRTAAAGRRRGTARR